MDLATLLSFEELLLTLLQLLYGSQQKLAYKLIKRFPPGTGNRGEPLYDIGIQADSKLCLCINAAPKARATSLSSLSSPTGPGALQSW